MKNRKNKKLDLIKLIDINSLITVKHYSEVRDETRQNVYVQIKNNKIKYQKIDGVLFIHKEQ